MNIFSHLKFKKAISLRFLNPSSQNTSSSLFPTATFSLSLLLKKSVMEFMTQTGIYNVDVLKFKFFWNIERLLLIMLNQKVRKNYLASEYNHVAL